MPSHPLRATVLDWLAVIKEGTRCRHERFGQYAEECEKFYDSAHNWMWKNEYSRGPQGFVESAGDIPYPTFHMTVNRVFEAVALFGPAMFQRYPQATVTPQSPPRIPPELYGIPPQTPQYDAMMGMQEQDRQVKSIIASLKEHYLNWLQVETNKKRHARRSITEALVAGTGVFFHELYQSPGSVVRAPRSRHISWRQLIKDPDARYDEDIQWIAVQWTHPVNLVEEKFGLPPGSLKGHQQSKRSQVSRQGVKDAKARGVGGESFDLLTYYEVYSKNGAGDKLKRAKTDYDLESLGKFVRLVVAENIPYPLNLPDEVLNDPEAVLDAVQWPIPFWLDEVSGNGWPVTELSYYDKSASVWGVSLFKPVIGWMRFVNWCMSFLADKVAASSHDYVAVMKSAAKEIKEQLLTQKGPIKLIEISEMMGQNINQVITLLQKPTFDVAIYKMVESAMEQIDKGTGLTDLVYGLSSTQMRSAQESIIKDDRVSVRPDDMAQNTEDWYSVSLWKEMMTAAWLLEREDVSGVLGEMGSEVFERFVLSESPEAVVRDYTYRIISGSAKKPNKAAILRGLTEFGNVIMPVLQQFATQGITEPWNAYVLDVAKAMEIQEPERYLVALPPPEAQGPSPEQVKLVNEQQKHEQKMVHAEDEHDQTMEFEREKMNLQLQGQRQKNAVAARKKASSNGSR